MSFYFVGQELMGKENKLLKLKPEGAKEKYKGKYKEYQKKYRENNKEYFKKYRENNKEYFKKYREYNKEHYKEYYKEYSKDYYKDFYIKKMICPNCDKEIKEYNLNKHLSTIKCLRKKSI